jgi:hypothetical protein
MRTFEERFADFFAEQDSADQVAIFNEWASETGHEQLEHMDNFNEVCSGWEPLDIVMRARYGCFNPYHEYFTFDGYANLESIDCVSDWLEDYVSDMADWYENNLRTLAYVAGVAAWSLEEDEEEDEEEQDEEQDEIL